jgi:hypothetical protein
MLLMLTKFAEQKLKSAAPEKVKPDRNFSGDIDFFSSRFVFICKRHLLFPQNVVFHFSALCFVSQGIV